MTKSYRLKGRIFTCWSKKWFTSGQAHFPNLLEDGDDGGYYDDEYDIDIS